MKGVLVRENSLRSFRKIANHLIDEEKYLVKIFNQRFYFWSLEFQDLGVLNNKLKETTYNIGVMYIYEKNMLPVLEDLFEKNLVVKNLAVILGKLHVLVFSVVKFLVSKILEVLMNLTRLSQLKNE